MKFPYELVVKVPVGWWVTPKGFPYLALEP